MYLFLFSIVMIGGLNNMSNASSPSTIKDLDDLRKAVSSPSWFETVQDMDTWLPSFVSSISWQSRLLPHFLVHYHNDFQDIDDNMPDTLLNEFEKIHKQLLQFFHIEPQSKQERIALQTRFTFFIIHTKTDRSFGSLTDPFVLFYFLDTQQDPNYMNRFRHEIAHMIWGRSYGEAPPLFQEGVAVYAEYMSNPDANHSDFLNPTSIDIEQIPRLSEIAITENFWKHQSLYTISGIWIYFLIEKWGWDKLKALFLLSQYEDPEIANHFYQIYGQKLEEVEIEWRHYLKSLSTRQ